MESFQGLLDAGWGDRFLEPGSGGCPGCGAVDLVVVESEQRASKVLCLDCDRCWSVEAGRARRVDPVRCPGCRHRARCFERLRQDLAQLGPLTVGL